MSVGRCHEVINSVCVFYRFTSLSDRGKVIPYTPSNSIFYQKLRFFANFQKIFMIFRQ